MNMRRTTKIHIAAYSALAIFAVVMFAAWRKTQAETEKLEIEVTNSYDRAFFELSDYVSDIDVLLTKAQLVSTPAQLASISNEIFMQAAEAKSCFSQLPQGNGNLEKTAKFLSQVGDYTYVLSQNMINGHTISQDEYETLGKLNDFAGELAKNLDEIEAKIYTGEINFAVAKSSNLAEYAFAADDIFDKLENVEKSFEGYPSLIYDGPFSEHIENVRSQMLQSAKEVSAEEALGRAKEFLGEKGDGIEFESEMKNTSIESYVFSKRSEDEQISVCITKKGGYVLYFIKNREVKKATLNSDMATAVAGEYLRKHGYSDMESSYYEITDNIATINFAPVIDGVKMYSDLIKVKVALDNGEVVGLESKGYLMNHKSRAEMSAGISAEKAKEKILPQLSVGKASLAVIPKDSLREVLCYEFHGTYKDKNFIIYINAQDGSEEEILLLIESETGILTI